MIADRLSLAALMAANAFEKARAKRRNIPYTPFAPTKSQLEDWKEVVLAVRATDDSQPEPASPWRDIESAPKDGTKILAWFTWPGRHSVEMARWQSNQFAKQPKPYWTCDNERPHGIIATRAAQPTHWMPLPEPPR